MDISENSSSSFSSETIKKIKRNKQLFSNFTSLSFLQLSNYIFPLITLPFLVRVLGPERFGLVSFIIAFSSYFAIITDYGFNLSGTQIISINRNDKNKLSNIFSSILIIKSILFLFCLIVFSFFLLFLDKFNIEMAAFIIGFLSVIGHILFPMWLFMGLEKMNYISIINVTIKAIFTILVFMLIKSQQSYIIYLYLYSAHLIIIGILGIFFSYKTAGLQLKMPKIIDIVFHFKEGWYVFLSTFSISLYTISNTVILGFFAGNEIVGYFSAADKIRTAIQGIYSTISQTVYPHLSSLFVTSKENALKFVKKLFFIITTSGIITSVITLILANKIVTVFLGEKYSNSIVLLQIMSFLPLIIMAGNVFGVQTLLNAGFKKSFSKIIVISAVINLILSFIFVPLYKAYGTAIIVMIVESIVTIGFYIELRIHKINIFRQNYV